MRRDRYSEERRKSLEKRLAFYSTAAGATLLAAAGSAEAQTVYVDIEPDSQLVQIMDIDLNQDGTNDVRLYPSTAPTLLAKANTTVPWSAAMLFLSNSVVSSMLMYGPSLCSYGLAISQSLCSSASFMALCPTVAPTEAHSKVATAAALLIPSDPGDYFLKLAGMYDPAAAGAAAKSSAPTPFQAWVRFGVMTGGPSPLPVFVKDHAFFPSGEEFTCDPLILLPVELLSFEARYVAEGLQLVWETGSELNNAGFEVQYRAEDQDVFSALAFVEGAGTTVGETSYSHTVGGLEPGGYLFRLKQIDFDGAFEYSFEVEATVEVPGTHYLGDAYPNPFNPQAHFSLVVAQEQAVRVDLFDATGRNVAVLYEGSIAADTPVRLAIDGADLPSGTYLYRATGETFSETKQLVLNK